MTCKKLLGSTSDIFLLHAAFVLVSPGVDAAYTTLHHISVEHIKLWVGLDQFQLVFASFGLGLFLT